MKEKYITFNDGNEDYVLPRQRFLKVILINQELSNEDKLKLLKKAEFSEKNIICTLLDLLKSSENIKEFLVKDE